MKLCTCGTKLCWKNKSGKCDRCYRMSVKKHKASVTAHLRHIKSLSLADVQLLRDIELGRNVSDAARAELERRIAAKAAEVRAARGLLVGEVDLR